MINATPSALDYGAMALGLADVTCSPVKNAIDPNCTPKLAVRNAQYRLPWDSPRTDATHLRAPAVWPE